MTTVEFKAFLLHALGSFPTIADVFTASKSPDVTREAWYAALSECELDDCLMAINVMLRGDLEPPRYKWDTLPAIVRTYAKAQHRTPSEEETPAYIGDYVPLSADKDFSETVEAVKKRMAETGETAAEAMRAIDPWKDSTDDPNKQPRYKCRHCLDSQSGYVLVWRHCVVMRFRDIYLDELPATWKADTFAWLHKNRKPRELFSAIVCCCESSAAVQKRGRKETPAVFDPKRMRPYRGDAYFEVDKLREWVRANQVEVGGAVEWDASQFDYKQITEQEFN